MHSVSVLTLFSSSPFLACCLSSLLQTQIYGKFRFRFEICRSYGLPAIIAPLAIQHCSGRTLSWLNHHRIFCSINAGTAISAQKSSLHRLAVHTTIFSCFRNVPKAMSSFSPRSVQYSMPQHRLRTTLSYSASISRTKTSRDLTREFRCWQIC